MLTLEQAPQLFAALRAEYSNEGRQHLIELHLPLVNGMARKYARRIERQPDDYIGEAELALVESVDTALRFMTHDEITRYVVKHVKSAMRTFYMTDKAVAMPRRTQDHYFKLGHLVNTEIRPLEEAGSIAVINDETLLQSLIELLPIQFHRQVLMLKLAGHTDSEIGVLLAATTQEVRVAKRFIREKLTSLLEN